MTDPPGPAARPTLGSDLTREPMEHAPDGASASGWWQRWGIWIGAGILALLAYVPALASSPGRMPADTKLFLYLDPDRLISDAPWTFDGRQFAGWVPHQVIAYLWPQGPWFSLGAAGGVPDWITHRLWIGTLLFAAGAGVLWCGRRLGLGIGAAFAAACVYQFAPYILPYVSRTSAMLLPWAGLGWIVGLTVLAATRTKWRHAALCRARRGVRRCRQRHGPADGRAGAGAVVARRHPRAADRLDPGHDHGGPDRRPLGRRVPVVDRRRGHPGPTRRRGPRLLRITRSRELHVDVHGGLARARLLAHLHQRPVRRHDHGGNRPHDVRSAHPRRLRPPRHRLARRRAHPLAGAAVRHRADRDRRRARRRRAPARRSVPVDERAGRRRRDGAGLGVALEHARRADADARPRPRGRRPGGCARVLPPRPQDHGAAVGDGRRRSAGAGQRAVDPRPRPRRPGAGSRPGRARGLGRGRRCARRAAHRLPGPADPRRRVRRLPVGLHRRPAAARAHRATTRHPRPPPAREPGRDGRAVRPRRPAAVRDG